MKQRKQQGSRERTQIAALAASALEGARARRARVLSEAELEGVVGGAGYDILRSELELVHEIKGGKRFQEFQPRYTEFSAAEAGFDAGAVQMRLQGL